MEKFYKLGVYETFGSQHFAPSVMMRKISPEEVFEIKSKNNIIFKYFDFFNAWFIFSENHKNYEKEVTKQELDTPRSPFDYLSQISQITKASLISKNFANVLNSSFPFFEASTRALKSKYGEKSEEFEIWDFFRRELYSKSREYRLCYELRNYLQHYSLPIDGTDVDFDRGKIKSTKPYATKNILLNSGYNWKGKAEIFNAFDEKIDLDDALDKFHSCLNKIFHKTLDFIFSEINEFELHLNSIYKKYGFDFHENMIIFEFEEERQEPHDTKQEFLPILQLRFFKKIIASSEYEIQISP